MTKVVINMELRPRRGDIARASKALGVTDIIKAQSRIQDVRR